MKITTLNAGKFVGALVLLGLVAGCNTTSPFADSRRFSTPLAQLKPVTGSNVKSSELPPLTQANNSPNPLTQASDLSNPGNQGANDQTAGNLGAGDQSAGNQSGQNNSPGRPGDILLMPNGQPAQIGIAQNQGLIPGAEANGQPAQIGVQQAQGSIVGLAPNGVVAGVASRNLSGGLTIEKLLGSWTIISGADQCKINLTQTVKSGTNRYRASAPNCPISTLSGLASWQLIGSQVQFYNNSGQMIGALLQSGNRFIGTLAGGKGVSMVG